MLRRGVALAGFLALLAGAGTQEALAHAGLQLTDPPAGARLDVPPAEVKLSFSERPAATLSEIHVLDSAGAAHETGPPRALPGNALAVGVSKLGLGVYTVSWRTVSAVDGHATAGAFTFGVRVTPNAESLSTVSSSPSPSVLELVARWLLLAGLAALLGVVVADLAAFGAPGGGSLATIGWILAIVGVLALSEAQQRTTGASLRELLDTSVGRALVWRTVLLYVAGAGLLVARWGPARARLAAMAGAGAAVLAAIAVHVAAGHAGAGSPRALAIATQWGHFAAVGMWLGGLAALLLFVRGAATHDKGAAVRRFSRIAAFGLVVVAVTGVVRGVEELSAWSELATTGYGRAVLAKALLLVGIAALGALNRRRSVPVAASNLGRLRRTSRFELGLAAAALAVAALLGTISPPADAQPPAPGLSAEGADFATTTRVKLEAASARPGPNRFAVDVRDSDTADPIRARRVTLRFIPLDDPGVPATSLRLIRTPDGTYVGSGANLAFDGRWRVAVLVERGGDSVEVPLELETRSEPPFVSTLAIPGRPPAYTVDVEGKGAIRIWPQPAQPGPSKVYVTCYDLLADVRRIETITVTIAAGAGPTRRLLVRRLGPGRFVAAAELAEGENTIGVVASAPDGTRLRATVDLDVDRG